MSLRFIGQPFDPDLQIGGLLRSALRAPDSSSLWIATAWAKRSGVGRIRSAVTDFAAAGGTSEVIVGVDEGGATREGLLLCLELFDDVYVYHDPGPRTFHPKIYAVEGADQGLLIVGSGNLTKGGLFTNYEAALVLEAQRDNLEDWQVRDDIRTYFDRLLTGGDAVRRLDEDLIDLLDAEGWVTSEARQNAQRSARSRTHRERQRVFGRAIPGLASAPPPDEAPLPGDDEDEDSLPPPEPSSETEGAAAPPADPQHQALLIEVRPHHNGEIFLSMRAIDDDPDFFGFPFTGRTTPTRVGNPPYPMAVPDPHVEIVVHDADGRVIVHTAHSLNLVYYATKSEIRITIPPEPLANIPQMSLLAMTRDPAPGVDYRLDFYPPDCHTDEVEALRARLTTELPSGGAPVARRYGWN